MGGRRGSGLGCRAAGERFLAAVLAEAAFFFAWVPDLRTLALEAVMRALSCRATGCPPARAGPGPLALRPTLPGGLPSPRLRRPAGRGVTTNKTSVRPVQTVQVEERFQPKALPLD